MKISGNKQKVFWLGVSLCLALAVCLSGGIFGSAAAKAATKNKKVSLNNATLILGIKDGVGSKCNLKVKNPSKKIIWKTSNKKIAIVKSVSGKKQQKAVIQAKKAGTCTITAKAGKQKQTCKVTVKSRDTGDDAGNDVPDSNNSSADLWWNSSIVTQGAVGVYLTNVEVSDEFVIASTKLYNGTNHFVSYGEMFSIQKWDGAQWTMVEPYDMLVFPAIAILMPAQSEHEKVYKWPLKNPLTTGQYRLKVSMYCGEESCPVYDTVEFSVIIS